MRRAFALLVFAVTSTSTAAQPTHHRHHHAKSGSAPGSPTGGSVPPSAAAPRPIDRMALPGLVGLAAFGIGWGAWGLRRTRQVSAELAIYRARLNALQASQQATEWQRERNKQRWADNDVTDTDNQLRFIEAAKLQRRPLLNQGEERVFKAALGVVRHQTLKLCPQVNLGEIIRTVEDDRDADNAFRSINSKRVDLLICDQRWWPLVAIEHQGKGHFQGNAEARDQVKRVALERAGIALVETYDDLTEAEIGGLLHAALEWIRARRSS